MNVEAFEFVFFFIHMSYFALCSATTDNPFYIDIRR